MVLQLSLLALPLAFCNVQFPDTTSHSIVAILSFVLSTVLVLGPCIFGLIRIKRAVDKDRAADLIGDMASDLPHLMVKRSQYAKDATDLEMTDLPSFKTWFTLFEKRVSTKP